MAATKWNIGQTVEVQSRTWAGINREGGCGRITKIHYAEDGTHVEALDVKYVLSGCIDKSIDPAIVSPFETLQRGGRKRRGREFLMEEQQPPAPAPILSSKSQPQKNTTTANTGIVKEAGIKTVTKTNTTATTTTATTNTKNKPKPRVITTTTTNTNTLKNKKQGPKQKKPRTLAPVDAAKAPPLHSPNPSKAPTPESAPITPEQKPKVQKVTSIPLYVIADSSIQVSPLPSNERPKKKIVTNAAGLARRGLFGNGDVASKEQQQQQQQGNGKLKLQSNGFNHRSQLEATKTTAIAAAMDLPVITTPKVSKVPKEKMVLQTNDADAKNNQCDGKLNDAAAAASGKGVADDDNDDDSLKISRRRPNGYDDMKTTKPKPILQFTRQNKVAQKKSPKGKGDSSANRKPLKEVYDHEVKKAQTFVDEVLGSRKQDEEIVPVPAKENNQISKKLLEKPIPDMRYRAFLSAFRIIRMKAEEGTIEECVFRKLVNEKSTVGSFTDEEINSHLSKLCDDGKIMRSSGTLYIID